MCHKIVDYVLKNICILKCKTKYFGSERTLSVMHNVCRIMYYKADDRTLWVTQMVQKQCKLKMNSFSTESPTFSVFSLILTSTFIHLMKAIYEKPTSVVLHNDSMKCTFTYLPKAILKDNKLLDTKTGKKKQCQRMRVAQ